MSLLYYQPWPRQLGRLFAGVTPAAADHATWSPAVDIQEDGERFVVRADMPGVAAKDIEVSAEAGKLTVRGTRAKPDGAKAGFEHLERASGTFVRRFSLPESAHVEAIQARYADGVLEVTIPKQPRMEPKRIAVTVN